MSCLDRYAALSTRAPTTACTCALLTESKGRCDLHSYPNLGHTLSRRLDARSQQQGRFDWDPVATADADAKVWEFLRSLGYIAKP